MKNILQKIRNKPPEFRMVLAVILAVIVTGLIATGWVWSLTSSQKPADQNNAPSPFAALGQSIKSTVQNSHIKSSTETNTQIINANDVTTAHDETNPYQATVTQ